MSTEKKTREVENDAASSAAPSRSMKEEALALARMGYPVLPCHGIVDGRCSCANPDCTGPGKRPSTRNGVKDASADPAVVSAWPWEDQNVGMATTHMLVADFDGEEGLATLAELEAENGPLPYTLSATTGGGGRHVFFKLPTGKTVKNRVRVAKGFDVRTDGGFVIVAPSKHISGHCYRWDTPPDTPLAEAPDWLIKLVTTIRPLHPDHEPAPPTDGEQSPPSDGKEREENTDDLVAAFAKAKLHTAVAAIKNAKVGERNNVLNTQSFIIGQVVGAAQIDRDVAMRALVAAGKSVGLSAAEVDATVKSGLDAGAQQPRDLFLDEYELSDLGNGDRLVAASGDNIRFSPKLGEMIWDDTRWVSSSEERLLHLAKEMVRNLTSRARALEAVRGQKAAKRFLSHAQRSQSHARIKAAIALAKGDPAIWVEDDFNADPWALNLANGTLDLKTGVLREHNRADLLTKKINIAYDPGAKHPVWDQFLLEIFDGNTELVAYLQRAVGYALTADTSEQCLFFFVGNGRNGKSTLANALLDLAGEYGTRGSKFLLVERKGGKADDDAVLYSELWGVRLAIVQESEEGNRICESSLKEITGSDRLRARIRYGHPFTFAPSHTLFLCTNFRPLVRGGDPAVERRLHLLPFNVTIPQERVDKKLPEKIRAEITGVLAWAIEGCLAWQKVGLAPPEEIRKATEQYVDEHDTVGEMLKTEFILDPGGRIERGRLYHFYRQWMTALGEAPASAKRFYELLRARGFKENDKSHKNRFFLGLREPDPFIGPRRPETMPEGDDDD